MLIGIIFYRKSYPWYKHVGTFLLCSGIVAFSYWKQSGAHGAATGKGDDGDDFYSLCVGILLVGMNLALDGEYLWNERNRRFVLISCKMWPYLDLFILHIQVTPTTNRNIFSRSIKYHLAKWWRMWMFGKSSFSDYISHSCISWVMKAVPVNCSRRITCYSIAQKLGMTLLFFACVRQRDS